MGSAIEGAPHAIEARLAVTEGADQLGLVLVVSGPVLLALAGLLAWWLRRRSGQ